MLNKNIIYIFEKLVIQKEKNVENKRKLNFKIRHFNNVITIIKEYNSIIKTSCQLKDIKGIGKGILTRIDEILLSDNLKELNKDNVNLKNNIEIEKLISITGIGEVKANDLFNKKITLDILLKEYTKYEDNIEDSKILINLTHHQIVGLKYYYDLKLLIPRQEIDKLQKKIKKNINNIDKSLEVIVCGSYRRKKERSGDMDILILHKKLITNDDIEKQDIEYLKLIVETLKYKNILVDSLTDGGNTKYMGVCKLVSRSKGRRIDIRFIPYISKASALLYFTGSGNFNKIMRLDAKKKGYLINEYGLYKINKPENILIETLIEEDIFKELKMEYLEPENRI